MHGLAALLIVGSMVVMSIIAFVAYGYDKRQAGRNRSRVAEKTLHLMALLGGWPGALLGQRVFRHKTQKTVFRAVFFLTLIAHVAAVGVVVYLLQAA